MLQKTQKLDQRKVNNAKIIIGLITFGKIIVITYIYKTPFFTGVPIINSIYNDKIHKTHKRIE